VVRALRNFIRRKMMAVPKGRMTIRKSGGKRVRLWQLEPIPGILTQSLFETSYR
jgi:hypothetical protein